MALPRYLAQTAEEFQRCSPLPAHPAWMACHFSPYGTGLVNLPPALPKGAMVILNDRIPMAGHDPETVLRQLRQLSPHCLLLDFQRPPSPGALEMARQIVLGSPCPVGVTQAYGQDLDCPLFLPPPPPDTLPEEHLGPWQSREIWLELGLDAMTYTVTEQGAVPGSLSTVPQRGSADKDLCCHYRIDLFDDRAEFSLWRTRKDLELLLEKAEAHGVTKAVGLWQELGK